MKPREAHPHAPRSRASPDKPTLRPFTTTLWEYPSQHYDPANTSPPSPTNAKAGGSRAGRTDRAPMQGDKAYAGATPSWVIWQLLQRYTREGDLVIDPMCGSGTTIDVCADLNRRVKGFDLAPSRPDITRADARKIPLADASVDFAFIDPPYSTHIDYSDDPACIGKLDAGGEGDGRAYYESMEKVIRELHRVLKDRRYMALYVSDSYKKGKGPAAERFMPIGFELFAIIRKYFKPIDIISVVRKNSKLSRGNWHATAEESNFYLRGFNYLFIAKKELPTPAGPRGKP